MSELAAGPSEMRRNEIIQSLNQWARDLTFKAWIVCLQSEDVEAGKHFSVC